MNNLQKSHFSSNVCYPRAHVLNRIGVILLAMCAFVLGSRSLLPSANAASVSHPSASSLAAVYPISVFFSRSPESFNDVSAVSAVDRTSPTIAVGTFALQLLIAGPTLSEQHAGFFTELGTMLSGPSNCAAPLPVGGPDFTLTLNMQGSSPQIGTATVKFCRTVSSAGIGADGRVSAEIHATLTQFASIKNVVILTQNGHCFGDESRKDFCLR